MYKMSLTPGRIQSILHMLIYPEKIALEFLILESIPYK